MGTKEDWVMEPVGVMCHYESLINGTLDLFDIWRMKEKMRVDNENRSRIEADAMRRAKARG